MATDTPSAEHLANMLKSTAKQSGELLAKHPIPQPEAQVIPVAQTTTQGPGTGGSGQ